MPPEVNSANPGDRVILLSSRELGARYADAAAQAKLLAELLRLAERIGRRRDGPVAIPVRVRRRGTGP